MGARTTSASCVRCGLRADARVHNATANGHDFQDPADAMRAELAAINAQREAAMAALREANRAGITGASAGSVLDLMDAVDARRDAAQQRWFGTKRYAGYRLIVALGSAVLVSPTGRSSVELWRAA